MHAFSTTVRARYWLLAGLSTGLVMFKVGTAFRILLPS